MPSDRDASNRVEKREVPDYTRRPVVPRPKPAPAIPPRKPVEYTTRRNPR